MLTYNLRPTSCGIYRTLFYIIIINCDIYIRINIFIRVSLSSEEGEGELSTFLRRISDSSGESCPRRKSRKNSRSARGNVMSSPIDADLISRTRYVNSPPSFEGCFLLFLSLHEESDIPTCGVCATGENRQRSLALSRSTSGETDSLGLGLSARQFRGRPPGVVLKKRIGNNRESLSESVCVRASALGIR